MTFKEFLAISEGGDTTKTIVSMKPAMPARTTPGPLGITANTKVTPVRPITPTAGVVRSNLNK